MKSNLLQQAFLTKMELRNAELEGKVESMQVLNKKQDEIIQDLKAQNN